MNSVEKRHSSRRSSSGHRKHSDGGYSDTSSGGSFLDETDREVSNLTDRAFRSLCIGDEAVYNDSDLGASSPSMPTERQQAFCQSGQDWEKERGREELKRSAHENFSLQLEQYGQEWVQGGLPVTEAQVDPQWWGDIEGRTGGRHSATFQHSFIDDSQHQRSLNKEHSSFLSNGGTEFSTEQRRSRSRVSSLIKAFNSDSCRDGVGLDSKLKEWDNEANWDRSALMSMQRELSEFSTAYGQNLNSGPFPAAGPFTAQGNFCSSQVATAVTHMDSSSFMKSSHSKHSMSTVFSSNSNVFMHSEYSPFRLWRDHNRFPFQHGEVSGYMHSSDFKKWYETPIYKELSLGPEPHLDKLGHTVSKLDKRSNGPRRKSLEHVVAPSPPRSSSTSTVLQKAFDIQKRCDSEFSEYHNIRKRTQSVGTNKFPSQRPSTVSPTSEMPRQGRDTLNSINDLHQKFKMMTEQSNTTCNTTPCAKAHGVLHINDSLSQSTNRNTTTMVGEQVVSSNTRTTPFNISQLLTPVIRSHQDMETSEVQLCAASPPALEHAPVRAESRGATPDVRLSSYKARASSLLFNLKDNRRRVKSTYSPTKFKGLENFDKNKQPFRNNGSEPRDTVIDMPDFHDALFQAPQVVVQGEPSMECTTSHQLSTGHHGGITAFTPNLTTAHGSQDEDYNSGDYLKPQVQTDMFNHPGFNSYSQDKYTSKKLSRGHILQEDSSNTLNMASSPLPKHSVSLSTTDASKLRVDYTNQTGYRVNTASAKQHFTQSMRGETTHMDRHEQVNDDRNSFTNVSSDDSWKHHCHNEDKSNPQWQGEVADLTEKDLNAQFSPREDMMTDEIYPPPRQYDQSKGWDINTKQENMALEEAEDTSVYPQKDVLHNPFHALVNSNISTQPAKEQQYSPFCTKAVLEDSTANEKPPTRALEDYGLQDYWGNIQEHGIEKKHLKRSTEQEYTKQRLCPIQGDYKMFTQERAQRKQDVRLLKEDRVQRYQPDNVKEQSCLHIRGKPTSTNQDEQHVNVEEGHMTAGTMKEEVEISKELQGNSDSVIQELMQKVETSCSTQEHKELITEGQTPEGQPHAERTSTQKLNVDQRKEGQTPEGQPHAERTSTQKLNVDQRKEGQTPEGQPHAERTSTQKLSIDQRKEGQTPKGQPHAERTSTQKLSIDQRKEGQTPEGQPHAERTSTQKLNADQRKEGQTPEGQPHAERTSTQKLNADQRKEGQTLEGQPHTEQTSMQKLNADQRKEEQTPEGQPHAERTSTQKLNADQRKEARAERERGKQVGAQQAEEKEIKAEKNADTFTEVAQGERSRAEEATTSLGTSPDEREGLTWTEREGVGRAEEKQIHAEHSATETIKSEQVLVDQRTVAHIEAQHGNAEREGARLLRMEETKAGHIRVEDAIEDKSKEELVKAEKIIAKYSKLEMAKKRGILKEAEAEQTKVDREEKAKADQSRDERVRDEQKITAAARAAKSETSTTALARIERVKAQQARAKRDRTKQTRGATADTTEDLAKSTFRNAERERFRQETDKVEKVKRELAKAKAELAKIKEKTRDEPKEKNSPVWISKEADKDALQIQTIKHEHCKEEQRRQTEDSMFKYDQVHFDRGANVYERVREKYGFSQTALTNRKPSSEKYISPRRDTERSPLHIDKGKEATDNRESKDAEDKKSSIKCEEKQYVYSESSKEFKLSNSSHSSTPENKQTRSKTLDNNIKEKASNTRSDPVMNNVDVSLPGAFKSLTHERKLKPTENVVVQNKGAHSTTLSHKERTQTKQEILTSKIKAHAEKEISAIKEKGFAFRDGFLGKNHAKHLASGKSVQQRPPSQEVTKACDKTISTSQEQEPTIPVNSSLPTSVVILPVKPSNATASRLQRYLPQEPQETNNTVMIQNPMELNQTQNNDSNRDEKLEESRKESGSKAATQTKELDPISLAKEEVMTSGEHAEMQKDHPVAQAVMTADPPNEKKVDPKAPLQPEKGSAHETHETRATPEETPSIKLSFGQHETPAIEESLEIMGIMVTVRERKQSGNMAAVDRLAEKEASDKQECDLMCNDNIKHYANFDVESTRENIAPDISFGQAEDNKLLVLQSQPTLGIEDTKVGANNYLKKEPEESKVSEKNNPNPNPAAQEPMANKEDSSDGMKPAQNVSGETQPVLFKQGVISEPVLFKQGSISEKAKIDANKTRNKNVEKSNINDDSEVNFEMGHDPSLVKEVETGFSSQKSSVNEDIKPFISHPMSEKEEMADYAVTSSKSYKIQDSAALLVEKRKDSSPASAPVDVPAEIGVQNKNSLIDGRGNRNIHLSMATQLTTTDSREIRQDEQNVHIDCIAIRVMPEVVVQESQENTDNGFEQDALPCPDRMVIPDKYKDGAILSTPAIKQLQPIKEQLEVQYMPQKTVTTEISHVVIENQISREAENHLKAKTVKATASDTEVQWAGEEYFQLQGVPDVNENQHIATLDGGDLPGTISNIKEKHLNQALTEEHPEELRVPRTTVSDEISLVTDNISVNSELHVQQEAKHVVSKANVPDNVRETTMISDLASLNMKSINEHDSKKSCAFPESQSKQRVNTEHSEDIQIKTDVTHNKFTPSGKERSTVNTEISEDIHIKKHVTHNKFTPSGKERSTVREFSPTSNIPVSAAREHLDYKQEAKSKPKERVSTIPEISALADYARLKVIAADDRPDTVHEHHPSKKEGFFPRIQTRHSRRPVFTTETPAPTISKKPLSKEPRPSPKINKEPKCLVFANMEQDHKRTGMFKLKETEKQENVLLEVKTKDGRTGKMHPEDSIAACLSTPAAFKNRVDRDTKGLHQEGHRSILSSQDTTVTGPTLISSANIKKANISLSQCSDQPINSTQAESSEGDDVCPKEKATEMDNNSLLQTTFEQMFNGEQNKGEGSNATVNDVTYKDKTEGKQDKQRKEKAIIQKMNEERRAPLEMDSTKDTQIEQERRKREMEDRTARIEERRDKLREIAKIAEEERTAKLVEEKAAQKEIEKKRKEIEEKRALQVEEDRIKQQREEEERKIKEMVERRVAEIVEETRAKQKEVRLAREVEAQMAKEREEKKRAQLREKERRDAQIKEEETLAQFEEERRETQEKEAKSQREEETRRAEQKELEQRLREQEERTAAEMEEERIRREGEEADRRERQDKSRPGEIFAAPSEEEQRSQEEEQKRTALMVDALQYYAIDSSATERRSRDKPPGSPVPFKRRTKATRLESSDNSGSVSRPYAPLSPAPASPPSSTSSPAPGTKPTMFRVKDNTFRGFSLTKSVKPRFHKSFGEGYKVGPSQGDPRGSDGGEEEQERMRRSAGTPIHHDTVIRSNRLTRESPFLQPASSLQEHTASRPEYRSRSRRSMALDEDDSRSVISNMSEDVESFATSAADLADLRGLYEYERPESACSFGSDMSRSLGKPPTVPPKSEKALRRAKRLTTRRIKKELSKEDGESPAPVEKALHVGSSSPSHTSELQSANRHVWASPHFSLPVSLTHAPSLASSVPCSQDKVYPSYRSSHASPHATAPVSLPVASPHATAPVSLPVTSPHATAPVSLPVASPHATAPVSLPVTSPHATGPVSLPVASPHATAPVSLPAVSAHHTPLASLPVAPIIEPSVTPSPIIPQHAKHLGPVTQYHVEPSYAQSYPLTQPKVLQDPGSGQYYVVDMPVQVKTKTFYDPETGKYVQLNVRQSSQGGFQPQQAYPHPRTQPKLQVQSQQQVAPPGKPYVLYQGYQGCLPGRQSMTASTLPPRRSLSGMSVPDALTQYPQSPGESQNYGCQENERTPIIHGHSYNSEQTPYMDTTCEAGKILDTNKANNTGGSYEGYPECETNSHVQGGLVYDASAQSGLQPRDIITMGELEDIMDVSDW